MSKQPDRFTLLNWVAVIILTAFLYGVVLLLDPNSWHLWQVKCSIV